MGGINKGDISVGVNQSWQNVTATRAIGTTYYNTTGKPIEIAVTVAKSDYCYLIFSVNGAQVFWSASVVQTGATNYPSASIVIPPNASYTITTGNSPSLYAWNELR